MSRPKQKNKTHHITIKQNNTFGFSLALALSESQMIVPLLLRVEKRIPPLMMSRL
jgi:predicted secreted protein